MMTAMMKEGLKKYSEANSEQSQCIAFQYAIMIFNIVQDAAGEGMPEG